MSAHGDINCINMVDRDNNEDLIPNSQWRILLLETRIR
jgi:hypothetical protein